MDKVWNQTKIWKLTCLHKGVSVCLIWTTRLGLFHTFHLKGFLRLMFQTGNLNCCRLSQQQLGSLIWCNNPNDDVVNYLSCCPCLVCLKQRDCVAQYSLMEHFPIGTKTNVKLCYFFMAVPGLWWYKDPRLWDMLIGIQLALFTNKTTTGTTRF